MVIKMRGDGEALELLKVLAMHRRIAIKAVRDFVEGAARGDCERMVACLDALDYGECDGGGWARAMRAVTRLASVPHGVKEVFLRVFIRYGDNIRQACNKDLVLADGLRVLLPTYEGPALRLYRGEAFCNRSRRTYGLSWTAKADVARQYAEHGFYRASAGGTVVLETFAPTEAIICAPALLDDRYAEEEYVVDRRRLASVKAIERFPQLSHDQMRGLQTCLIGKA